MFGNFWENLEYKHIIQFLLVVATIAIVFIVERLAHYNSFIYGAVSAIPGVTSAIQPPSASLASSVSSTSGTNNNTNISHSTQKKHKKK